MISLTGSRYPGTDLSADSQASIFQGAGVPIIQLKHSIAANAVEAPLIEWLAGKQALGFIERDTAFSTSVGEFLRINQVSGAHVSVSPSLALSAFSQNGWQVKGAEFSGAVDNFIVSRSMSMELISSDSPLQRAHITVKPAPGGARMSPLASAFDAQRDLRAAGNSLVETKEVAQDIWFDNWDSGLDLWEMSRHYHRFDTTVSLLWFSEEDLPEVEVDRFGKRVIDDGDLTELTGELPWPGKK